MPSGSPAAVRRRDFTSNVRSGELLFAEAVAGMSLPFVLLRRALGLESDVPCPELTVG